MHIMHMLGILSLVFLLALFLMCIFREKLKHPLINFLFICVCAVFFFAWNYAMFEHRGGFKNGIFMTFENISPYICTIIPLTPLMNKRVKDHAYSAIAFLAFGMFVAMFISPEVEYLFNYHQEAKFIHVSEAACHLIMALYGFYLILSDKVKLDLKSYGRALLFIYTSIGFGLFLNWCFKLSNFGMAMYGGYSIYFLDIFGSFEATLAAYLLGVLATITVGYLIAIFIDRVSRPREKAAIENGENMAEPTQTEGEEEVKNAPTDPEEGSTDEQN